MDIFDAVSTNWLQQMIWEERVDFRDKICPFSMTTTYFSGFYGSWKVAPPTFVNIYRDVWFKFYQEAPLFSYFDEFAAPEPLSDIFDI